MQLGKSLEKLSSGFRINRAADDAAGLVVSQGLRAQVSGLRQATRNAQDGISVVQTAEGALNEVHTMLNRMRDLAVQSANTGANDSAARTAANNELNALSTEISRISQSTKFGGVNLLDGTYGATAGKLSVFQTGSITVAAGDTVSATVTGGSGAVSVALSAGTYSGSQFSAMFSGAVQSALRGTGNAVDAAAANGFSASADAVGSGSAITLSNMYSANITLADGTGTPLATNSLGGFAAVVSAASGSGGTFQIGANANEIVSLSIGSTSASALSVSTLDIRTQTGASAAITALDGAISQVSTTRGNLGALQNRFESMINNLQVTTENLSASESRIRDTDMASEMVAFTRNQVLQQAGTAMLAQANQVPQGILQLLR